MSKTTTASLQTKYYNFLKFKNINRINSIFFFGLFNHIKHFCLLYNVLLLNLHLKFNLIFCYLYHLTYFNFVKTKSQIQTFVLFKKFIYFIYILNQLIYFFSIFIKSLKFILFIDFFKPFFCTFQFNNCYLQNNTNSIKIRKRNFKTLLKVKKIKSNLHIKNVNILLAYFLKNNYHFFNKKIIIKSVFSTLLINTFWIKSNTKKIFSFKNHLYSLLLTCFLTEVFQMASVFLNYLTFFVKQKKLHIKKQFDFKIINKFKQQLFFLLTYKLIYFLGFCLYLTGKLKKSMRKAKSSIKYGQISTQNKNIQISLDYNILITRAGVISFKLWLFF